jgi:hypothetical protein
MTDDIWFKVLVCVAELVAVLALVFLLFAGLAFAPFLDSLVLGTQEVKP